MARRSFNTKHRWKLLAQIDLKSRLRLGARYCAPNSDSSMDNRPPGGKRVSENVIWYVARRCAERVQLDHLSLHDLCRTCAKLCHVNGGELEQVRSEERRVG